MSFGRKIFKLGPVELLCAIRNEGANILHSVGNTSVSIWEDIEPGILIWESDTDLNCGSR